MKVYFTASVHGKEKYEKNYVQIVNALKDLGYGVHADHILKLKPEDMDEQDMDDAIKAHVRFIKMLRDSDVLVAEISKSSASVGHEITEAVVSGKPVILFKAKDVGKVSLIEGCSYDKMQVVEYDLSDVKPLVKQAMTEAEEMMDVRFNFFINSKILDYLNRVAKKRNIHRSVFIRELIEEKMRDDCI